MFLAASSGSCGMLLRVSWVHSRSILAFSVSISAQKSYLSHKVSNNKGSEPVVR